MQFQDEFADRVIRATAHAADEFAHGAGSFVAAGVMLFEQIIQRRALQRSGLGFIKDVELRVEAQFVEMFARELQTEAVQRADVRGIQQGELLREPFVVRLRGLALQQFGAQPLTHFRGGGFGERHHQDVFHRNVRLENQAQAARDECMRLARARAGDHEQIARAIDGSGLLWREVAHCEVAASLQKRR